MTHIMPLKAQGHDRGRTAERAPRPGRGHGSSNGMTNLASIGTESGISCSVRRLFTIFMSRVSRVVVLDRAGGKRCRASGERLRSYTR